MASFPLRLYRFELNDCFPITRTVHGAFGVDEGFEPQDAAFTEIHIDNHTLFFHGGEVPQPQNFAKAIKDSQVGFQVKVL